MKNTKPILCVATTTLFITFSIFANNYEEAKSMYEKDCTQCHDSTVFTRKDRKINDFDTLTKQVKKCVSASGASWFEEDEINVTAYLADKYYQFNTKKKHQ